MTRRPSGPLGIMPQTASRIARSGSSARTSFASRVRMPPGNSVWCWYSFLSGLVPVSLIPPALSTITKSPMSTLGVYVALCLPRSTSAMRDARRPSVWPVASITYHSRCASPASLVSQELFCVVIMAFTRSAIVYKTAKRLSSAASQCGAGWPMIRAGGEPYQLHRQAGHQVDVGGQRVDRRPGDLHPEGAMAEVLAGALGVVAEPELQQLARLDGGGFLQPHLVLAQELACERFIDELHHGGGWHGAGPYMKWHIRVPA